MSPSWVLLLLAAVCRANYLNCWLGEGERGKMTGGEEEESRMNGGEEEGARTAGEEEEARTAGLRQELEAWFWRMLHEQFPFPSAPEGLQEEDVLDVEDVLANMTGFFQIEVGLVLSLSDQMSLYLYYEERRDIR